MDRRMVLPKTLGCFGAALVLLLVWLRPLTVSLPFLEFPADSLWTEMRWPGVLAAIVVAAVLVVLAWTPKRGAPGPLSS